MCGSMNGMSLGWRMTGEEFQLEGVLEEFGIPGVIEYTNLFNNKMMAQNGFEDEMYEMFCERELTFFFAPATNTSILQH